LFERLYTEMLSRLRALGGRGCERERLLEVEGLSKHFGGVQAVRDLSFQVREGEILGVIGPNGSGKTTTFHLITGFHRPDRGHVRFKGEEITGLHRTRSAHAAGAGPSRSLNPSPTSACTATS